MLPRLDGLRLHDASRPRRSSLSTGEFYALTREDAKAHGADPIDLEDLPFKPILSSGEDPTAETFRIRSVHRLMPPNNDYFYHFFRASSLWEQVSRDRSLAFNPITREPIWREDWAQLHDRFAPNGPIPSWFHLLPRRMKEMHELTRDAKYALLKINAGLGLEKDFDALRSRLLDILEEFPTNPDYRLQTSVRTQLRGTFPSSPQHTPLLFFATSASCSQPHMFAAFSHASFSPSSCAKKVTFREWELSSGRNAAPYRLLDNSIYGPASASPQER